MGDGCTPTGSAGHRDTGDTSHDHIPFMGLLPRGGRSIYLATGFNKWGMTNAVAAAPISVVCCTSTTPSSRLPPVRNLIGERLGGQLQRQRRPARLGRPQVSEQCSVLFVAGPLRIGGVEIPTTPVHVVVEAPLASGRGWLLLDDSARSADVLLHGRVPGVGEGSAAADGDVDRVGDIHHGVPAPGDVRAERRTC